MDPEDPLVKKYIAIFTGPRKKEMEEALSRLTIYRPMILKHLKEMNLPRELLYLPVIESGVKNTATSRAGAVGLWQFMSSTGRGYGLKINYWLDERRDPEKSTAAGLRCLKDLHEWFDDWHLALAGYNRGVYGVERDMKFSRSPDFNKLAERKALPGETEHYVPKYMACVLIADDPAAYGLTVRELAPPAVDEVTLEKPLDLRVAAEAAGVPEAVLQELNPTVRMWCTPKNEPNFPFRIPAGTRERFVMTLSRVKDWTPFSGEVKYKVKKGDMLSRIAQRYKTSAREVQRLNRIKNPQFLRPGQVLIIRPGKGFRGN